jgi:uncharacterized protein YhaN
LRLLRLEVERFGALVDRLFDLDGRAFVLEGPNEAGKSSFHAAVETIFYGFQPATRDAHPYAAWGDGRHTLRLVALVELANGERWQVERRLASTAGLRFAREGVPLAGPFEKNAPLAELQTIPRPLFRAVYSLTANEVAEPDDREIQDLVDGLLLGDNGLVGMRSVRVLRTELAEERARLWRRDNRGEPRERQLLRELGEVRRATREACDAERALAADEERLGAARRRLAALRVELAEVERNQEDAEVLAELERLERLEAELARTDLTGFGARGHAPPDVPSARRPSAGRASAAGSTLSESAAAEVAAQDTIVVLEDPALVARVVAEAARALLAPRERLARAPLVVTPRMARLVEHSPSLEHLEVELAEDRVDTREAARARSEWRAVLERAHDLAAGYAPALAVALLQHRGELLEGDMRAEVSLSRDAHDGDSLGERSHDADPRVCAPLSAAPLEALRSAVLAWRDALEEERALADAHRGGLPIGAVLALGLVLAGLALADVLDRAAGAAGLALALGAATLVALRERPARMRPAAGAGTPEAVEVGAAAVGLGPASLTRPEATLEALEALDEAREAMRACASDHRRAVQLAAASAARHARWRGFASALLPDVAAHDAPADVLPRLLRDALVEARAALDAARRDHAERVAAKRALEHAERRVARERARAEALHAALRRALPDIADPHVAYKELLQQDRARSELVGERRLLARHPRFAALEHDPRRSQARRSETSGDGQERAGATPFWSPELQAARRTRREELRAELESTRDTEAQLAARLQARRDISAAELRSRELELELELRDVRRRHDRLALLERALVAGERRFRAAHQPDVLRAASEYLTRITGGRYGRIDYPDPEARVLMVHSRELDTLVPVGPPLSRGVREQVHLCLRLGTLEHLDRGREPLPLVLDEALVHWDPERRAALYPTLKALTERRQVILLTCQPEHAEESVRGLHARHVALGRPRGATAEATPLDTTG